MLHRASPHSFSPTVPFIESTVTVKFVSSKCGCCCRRNGRKLSSLLLVRSLYSKRVLRVRERYLLGVRPPLSTLRSSAVSFRAPQPGWYEFNPQRGFPAKEGFGVAEVIFHSTVSSLRAQSVCCVVGIGVHCAVRASASFTG